MFYTFEFTCPALALGTDIAADQRALHVAQKFFDDSWTQWDTRWFATDAHLEENGDIHIRFTWMAYDKNFTLVAPLLYPAPKSPDLATTHMVCQLDPGLNEPVILLNGIGLLEYWKFQRIVAPSAARVDTWPVRPGGPHRWMPPEDERTLLVGQGDTAFHFTGVQRWEFGKEIWDNSQINYYLQGYAMHHLNYDQLAAYSFVLIWKNWEARRRGLPPRKPSDLWAEYYWFDIGWGYHGFPE